MAVTITEKDADVWGKYAVVFCKVALDNSYATGGYGSTKGLAAQTIGLGSIKGAFVIAINAAGSGIVNLVWDYTNRKLMAFRVATFTPAGTIAKPTFTVTKGAILASSELGLSADAANATVNNDTIAATLTLLAANSPVGAPAFTGTAQGQVALAEVSNAVNLAAVTARLCFIGNPI